MDKEKFPMGMYHSSDMWQPKDYNADGCCFVYGSFDRAVQCNQSVTAVVKSKLRVANVCDEHRDEILRHHLQFDSQAVVE